MLFIKIISFIRRNLIFQNLKHETSHFNFKLPTLNQMHDNFGIFSKIFKLFLKINF